ncbi:MAG: AI-2E family transporter [Actinomycetota bacterium]|nr:AI-2E family transporter [Actinomycetota bacterium]
MGSLGSEICEQGWGRQIHTHSRPAWLVGDMAERPQEAPSTRTVVRIVLTVVGVLLLLYAAYLVRSILVLVLIAAFLAVGLDPAVRRLEKMGLNRGLAVAAIFFAAILFIAAFAFAVVPPLINQVTNFATDLPTYVRDLAESNPRIQEFVEENDISTKLREAVGQVPTVIGSSFGSVLGIAGSVLSALFNALTVLVLMIYFLLSLSRIRAGSLKLVPKTRRERVRRLMDPILEKIGGYIAGQLIVGLIAGVLSFIFLAIAGVPFPVALALWVAIAALIPLVGATIGAIPAVIVAFFSSVPLGAATLIFFLVYQQVENYVIAPKVMTKAVDVSPAAVLLAALIGGSLLGFVGALMAIPAAASLKLITHEILIPRAEAH